jgi:4-carboxymuconolactone decarboxylase
VTPARNSLPRRTYALVRLAASVSGGDARRIRAALAKARSARVPAEWIREVILQCHLFAGYPRAINALFLCVRTGGRRHPKTGSTGRRRESRAVWIRRGRRLAERVYGESFPSLTRNLGELHPELLEWMLADGYGRVLSRPVLDPLLRELAVIGSLVPLRVPLQLASHLHGARNLGAGFEAIEGAIRAGLEESSRPARREALRELARFEARRAG